MIYLIGGAPRTGKTILARKLSGKLGITWISADDIEQDTKAGLPEDQKTKLYPKDVIREKTQSSNDIMYTQYSADEILDSYTGQAKASWQAIKTLVNDKIKSDEQFIIEGFQVEPELMMELIKEFGTDKIKTVILTKKNLKQIVETALESQDHDDWFIKKTKNPDIHLKIGEMLAKYSYYFESQAKKYNIEVIEYKGDFDDQIEKALEILN